MKKLYLILTLLFVAIISLCAEDIVLFVKSSGNDTTGNGSLTNPFATINKAYSTFSGNSGTIALLSDITIDSSNCVYLNDAKNVTITSANPTTGNLLENKEENYSGVFKIIRDSSNNRSLIVLRNGNLNLKQVILDGGSFNIVAEDDPGVTNSKGTSNVNSVNKGGYLINDYADLGNTELVMDTNCILQNNWNIGSNIPWAGAVVVSYIDNYNNSTFNTRTTIVTMKSNAKVMGNKAPRHGGAFTVYPNSKLYVKDNAKIKYNGLEYTANSEAYFGGSAILAYGGKVYLSENADISENYNKIIEADTSSISKKHTAVLADSSFTQDENYFSYICVKDNVKIYDNFDGDSDEIELTYNNNQYHIKGTKQANAYAPEGFFKVEGKMGAKARIGLTVKNAAENSIAGSGSNYTLIDSDSEAFFDDSGLYSIVRSSNNLILSSSITTATFVIDNVTSTKLTGTLSIPISLTNRDITLFKNGIKLNEGFSVSTKNKEVTISLDSPLELNSIIGVSISKNGYKVNDGNVVEKKYCHIHEWVYFANGSALFAYCKGSDANSHLCSYHDEEHAVSLFMQAQWNAGLYATIQPSNATNKDVIWSSSDTSILTVDQKGFIHGVAPGTATVTATSTDGSNVTATCSVTLQEEPQ